MSDKKNVLDMTEEEYKDYFIKKFRKERESREGIGGMFEALLGTGDKNFIASVEKTFLKTAVGTRKMAQALAEAGKTKEGREEILKAWQARSADFKPPKEEKDDG